MQTRTYRTNLKCAGCLAKIAPVLDGDPRISSWSAALDDPRKPLTVTGAGLPLDAIQSLLRQAGYDALEEIVQPPPAIDPPPPPIAPWYKTYFPILLILAYLAAFVALSQLKAGEWGWISAMRNFMGGFFVVFSFFKLLNLSGFAESYASYDLAAMRLPAYGYVYPFVELALGAAYLAGVGGWFTDLITFSVMAVSTAGVARSLLKKHAIRCACLGTVFNLPMSKITLIEDLTMVVMSVVMIGGALFHSGAGR